MQVQPLLGDRFFILLNPHRKTIYPISDLALVRAQGSQREISECNVGALLLRTNGELRRIQQIRVLEPVGDTPWQRLLSRLIGYRRIDVQLSNPLDWPFTRLRALLADALLHCGWDEDQAQPALRARLADDIAQASDVAQMLSRLRIPVYADLLDVL